MIRLSSEEGQVSGTLDSLKQRVKGLFEEGEIKGFIGYRREGGHLVPALFRSSDEVDELAIDESASDVQRYPLSDICRRLFDVLPEGKLGILVRGCDERALIEMAKWNQIDLERVLILGIACSQDWIKRCGCKKPYPDSEIVIGEPVKDISFRDEVAERLEALSLSERKAFWDEAFLRCIKCYGCRNICPVCFCRDCSLEDSLLVKPGQAPAEFPVFHLVRAVHMAGRCIDCGLCEEACPANIPLRALYRKINSIMEEEFNYQTGVRDEKICPLNVI